MTFKKTLGSKSLLGSIIGETALGHPEYIPATIATFGGAHTGAKGIDFLTRIYKSSELKKYYAKALSAAALHDAGALRLYENKLEEILNQSSSRSSIKK